MSRALALAVLLVMAAAVAVAPLAASADAVVVQSIPGAGAVGGVGPDRDPPSGLLADPSPDARR